MADTRDWDKELARVDRQIGSMSDADLLAAAQAQKLSARESASGSVSASGAPGGKVARAPGKWGVYARVGMSLVLGVGLLFWPYDTRCGLGLFGYLLSAGMVCVTAAWGGIFSWKVRMPAMHILSISLFLWGIVMSGREILPRVGYAIANEAHPAMWMCK